MAKKHTFFIVVLLAAAAFAGFTAFARSVDLNGPAAANVTPTLPASALRERLHQLDRFEANLRKQLASTRASEKAVPSAVVTRLAVAPSQLSGNDDEGHEDDEGAVEND